jgi:hypothetical protein
MKFIPNHLLTPCIYIFLFEIFSGNFTLIKTTRHTYIQIYILSQYSFTENIKKNRIRSLTRHLELL